MGIFGAWKQRFQTWKQNRRKKKELEALEKLRSFLREEITEVQYLSGVVKEIEGHLAQGNFPEAERRVPVLAKLMKKKET